MSVFHPHAVSGSSFYSGPLQLLIRVHSDLVSPVVVVESVQDAVAQVSLFRSLRCVSCNFSSWRKRGLCISPLVVSAAVVEGAG